MRVPCLLIGVFTLLLATLSGNEPAGATTDGEALYKAQCQVCHTIEKGGEKRQGPNLWAVIGRTAGSIDGFPYSNGLKAAQWAWSQAMLDDWLRDPHSVFDDTYMMYKQKNPEIRAKIIAFMATKTD